MGQTVALIKLAAMIRPHARGALHALGGRPPFLVDTMLCIHCLQLRWNLSDPPMEEALHKHPPDREFAGLIGVPRVPDKPTIVCFWHLLKKYMLVLKVLALSNTG